MNRFINSQLDGLYVATGSVISTATATALYNPSVLAAIAGAFVSGLFIAGIKAVELWLRARNDRRVAELQAQLRAAGLIPRV